MKAALTDGKGKVWISELPVPELGDYECLCRIDACASCTGTDKKLISGTMSWAKPEGYPAVLGHESVGTVIATGKKVRHISHGDRFLRPAAWYSGTVKYGITSWMGGFAEYGIVTDTRAISEDGAAIQPEYYCRYQQPIPADLKISAADATMLVTLKEIYSFIRDIGIGSGDRVAILGAGAVGMSMCFFAKLTGAQVAVAARRPEPLQNCRAIGADHTVNISEVSLSENLREWGGVTYLLDAAGSTEMLGESSAALVPGGAICSYAGNAGLSKCIGELHTPPAWRFLSSPPREDTAHDHLISLARAGVIPFHAFYTEILPLNEITAGFERIFAKKSMKTVFVPGVSF